MDACIGDVVLDIVEISFRDNDNIYTSYMQSKYARIIILIKIYLLIRVELGT